MLQTFTCNNLEELPKVAAQLLERFGDKKIICFYGQMGAGKTTFIRALCDAMRVKDMVGSPTFSLVNEYEYVPITIGSEGTKKTIFHLDLYRIKTEEEAVRAGMEDVLYSGNICLVEWPEKAPGILPENTVHVFLELADDKTRRLKITDI